MHPQSNAILDVKTGEELIYSELLKGNRVLSPNNYTMTPQSGLLWQDDYNHIDLVELLLQRPSDGGSNITENLITIPIIDSTLTLTTDKYQTTTMEDNTTIVLPSVSNYTEIHLFFTTESELTLILPSCKWQGDINIEANKTYEFIFTYTNDWLGGCVVYE